MSFRSFFSILAFAPLLGACAEVVTSAPLGETPVAVSEDDWEGIWGGAEETYIIQVIDEETGELLVSELDPEESPPEIDPMEIQLSKVGDWYFGNWEEEPGEFSWFRVSRSGASIIVWIADSDRFKELVNQGVLPGEVRSQGGSESDKIFIGHLTEEHLNIITESTEGVLFSWDEPLLLHRVMGPDGVGGGRRLPSESPGEPSGDGNRRDGYRISADELAPFETMDAHEVVRRLRRFWLQGIGGKTPRVFKNGEDAGEASILLEYQVKQITELRFVPGKDATEMYGPDYAGGVIEVIISGE